MSKILVYDIESSGLKADWDSLLVFGYKWLDDKKIHTPTILDFPHKDVTDDRQIVKEAHRILGEADMTVTYYGKGFDQKFLFAKFLEHNLPALPSTPMVDLYFVNKANLALGRRSMDALASYLNVGAKKFYVGGRVWRKARIGDPFAMDKVRQHCERDVLLTEKIYLKLRPLSRQHPRVNDYWNCRGCGGSKLQRRGYSMTTTKGRMVRFRCNECGSWSTYPESDANGISDGHSNP